MHEPAGALKEPDAVAVLHAQRLDRGVPSGLERNCSIGDTISILSDTWTFLVIREAFFGAKRFTEFSKRLSIPRATLSATLQRLVEAGIFRAESLAAGSRWKSYALSKSGFDLYPIFLGLFWFGDRWMQVATPPLALFHKPCRSWFSPRIVWGETGAPVDPRDVTVWLGENYWRPATRGDERRRHISRDDSIAGRRPCSVERTLSIVGDRWTFLILREFFHGNRRFDQFMRNLPIASNVLSSRLQRLLGHDMIARGQPEQAYRLQPKGWDIYSPMIMLKAWGDRWLDPAGKPNMHFVSRANGGTLNPRVVCSACRETLHAWDVRYITSYREE